MNDHLKGQSSLESYIKKEPEAETCQRSNSGVPQQQQNRHIYNSLMVSSSSTALHDQIPSSIVSSAGSSTVPHVHTSVRSSSNNTPTSHNSYVPPSSSSSLTMLAALANTTVSSGGSHAHHSSTGNNHHVNTNHHNHHHQNPLSSSSGSTTGEQLNLSRAFQNSNLVDVARAIAAVGGQAVVGAVTAANVYPNHSPPPYPASDHQPNGSVTYENINNNSSGGSGGGGNGNNGNNATGSNGAQQYVSGSPPPRGSPYMYATSTGSGRHHHHHHQVK